MIHTRMHREWDEGAPQLVNWLSNIPISHNNLVLTKLITELWDCSNKNISRDEKPVLNFSFTSHQLV